MQKGGILFKSTESALMWAAQVRETLIYKAPSISRMCGKPSRPTDNDILTGLSPEEVHRQADNIYSMIINIDPVCEAYLLCKYFNDPDHVSRIVSRVHLHLTDRSRDLTMLILAYVGARIGGREITHRMIRESLCCHNASAADYRKIVYSIMDKLHSQSIDIIERKMIDAGLVGKW